MITKWNKPGVPHKGWLLETVIDIAERYTGSFDEDETCMMCGKEHIRYVHLLNHPEVLEQFRMGCVCAEKMTEDYVTSKQKETALRNRATRRKTGSILIGNLAKKGTSF